AVGWAWTRGRVEGHGLGRSLVLRQHGILRRRVQAFPELAGRAARDLRGGLLDRDRAGARRLARAVARAARRRPARASSRGGGHVPGHLPRMGLALREAAAGLPAD